MPIEYFNCFKKINLIRIRVFTIKKSISESKKKKFFYISKEKNVPASRCE
jgi:hypothetical protein